MGWNVPHVEGSIRFAGYQRSAIGGYREGLNGSVMVQTWRSVPLPASAPEVVPFPTAAVGAVCARMVRPQQSPNQPPVSIAKRLHCSRHVRYVAQVFGPAPGCEFPLPCILSLVSLDCGADREQDTDDSFDTVDELSDDTEEL